jgi:hypothetical protein
VTLQNQPAATSVPAFTPLLSDKEVADILVVTIAWVRSHREEIPGLKRLRSYLRFCTNELEQWLGSLDQLLEAETVATLMRVPQSWIYANADEIPGVLRLGRYVRFRPTVIRSFLSSSEVVQ